MPTFWVFETDVFILQKGLLLSKTSKIVFHDLFSRNMTSEYRALQGVTGGYKGLHEVKKDYKKLSSK